MYDYLEAIREDVKQYLEDSFEYNYSDVESLDELQERLYDDLWADDSVTGNGSGSYTFNRAKAQEYVTENMGYCIESLKEFCVEAETIAEKFLSEDWEYFDVTIRCYLLGGVIANLLEDAEADFEKWLKEREC